MEYTIDETLFAARRGAAWHGVAWRGAVRYIPKKVRFLFCSLCLLLFVYIFFFLHLPLFLLLLLLSLFFIGFAILHAIKYNTDTLVN